MASNFAAAIPELVNIEAHDFHEHNYINHLYHSNLYLKSVCTAKSYNCHHHRLYSILDRIADIHNFEARTVVQILVVGGHLDVKSALPI